MLPKEPRRQRGFLALENVDFQEEDYHFFLNETSVLNAIPQIKRLNA